MNRLLLSGYTRLFKNKLFWIGIAVSVGMGIAAGYTKCSEAADGLAADLTDTLFSFGYISAIVAAVLSPMFSGTEYSDGTIRNKIIAGHKRANIYLSNLILTATAMLLSALGFALPYVTICLLGIGKSQLPLSEIAMYFALAALSLLALCVLYNAVTMLTAKKAAAAVVCLLGITIGFMAALTIDARLQSPKIYTDYEWDASGNLVPHKKPNPKYLTGIKREVYQTALDVLPTGQLWQLLKLEVPAPRALAAYSAILCIAVTGAGIWVFQKKDLK